MRNGACSLRPLPEDTIPGILSIDVNLEKKELLTYFFLNVLQKLYVST